MRLVEVQEREEAAAALGVDPVEERRDGPRALALLLPGVLERGVALDRVVVTVEAEGDPRRGTQDERRHRGSGRETLLVEAHGQRPRRRAERVAGVVADTVARRQETREQRGVGRQCQRAVAVGVLEHDALAGEAVEMGRLALRVAVHRQAVGPQRVDGHEHDGDVAGNRSARGRRGGATARRREHGRGDAEGEGRCLPPPPQRPAPPPSQARTRSMSRASSATGAARRYASR